jgi:valyl-tRNA synthetase
MRHFEKFRLSDALMGIYKLIWDDFCSWYLEMIKPEYGKPIDAKTLEQTVEFFEKLMQLLHPFMPFITEDIWHYLRERAEGDDVIISQKPEAKSYDKSVLQLFDFASEIINSLRKLRAEKNIPFRDAIQLQIKSKNGDYDTTFDQITSKLCNISEISYVKEAPEGAFGFVARSTEFFVPLSENIDVEAELKKLEEELTYTKGFLDSVMKKLSNERFVANAPAKVLDLEHKKQADAESRIKVLEQQIKNLKA